jgi:tetratricopeptide (TPR) repeat protein
MMLTGRAAESIADAKEVLAIDQTLQKGVDLDDSFANLAMALVHARRYQEADAALAEFEALPGVSASLNKRSGVPKGYDLARAQLGLEHGQAAAVLAAAQHWVPTEANSNAERASLIRAAAHCAVQRFDEGLAQFGEWLPRLAARSFDANPELAHWRARMGLCALQAGNKQRAREASTLASAAIAKQPAVSAHFKAPVLELERRLRDG